MLLQWMELWTAFVEEKRQRAKRNLADPLDAPEWDGLLWVLPAISFLWRPLTPKHSASPESAKCGSHQSQRRLETLASRFQP